MALALGKLTILVGAGLVGSVLAKEGGLPSFSDLVSGGFKMVFKGLRQGETIKSVKKPVNDSLVAQVNNLKEQLQMLASNRPMTIISTSRSDSGGRMYGVIIVVVVVGYGYVWWKGWKLPDFMFATRRGLSEACNSVGKELDGVFSETSGMKRELSSSIKKLDAAAEEFVTRNTDTAQEVSGIRQRTARVVEDARSIRNEVEKMQSKISRFGDKQGETIGGVKYLCEYAQNLENTLATEKIQALPSNSTIPALEASPVTPSPKTGQVMRPLHSAHSASGLRDFGKLSTTPSISNGIACLGDSATSTPSISNGIACLGDSATSVGFGGINASRLVRTGSAINPVLYRSDSFRLK